MLLKLEPRGERSKAMAYATPFIAILLTLASPEFLTVR